MKIKIKNQEDFTFGIMIAGVVFVWFLFVSFAPKNIRAPETQEWLESQASMPSSGMEY